MVCLAVRHYRRSRSHRRLLAEPARPGAASRYAKALYCVDGSHSLVRPAIRQAHLVRIPAVRHVRCRRGDTVLAGVAALSPAAARHRTARMTMSRNGPIASTLLGLTRALSRALVSEKLARQPGLLQSLDPRVRLAGLLSLVLAVSLAHCIIVVLAIFAVAVLLALLSKVSLATLATRVWLVVLFFTGVIALPALFLTPGDALVGSSGGTLRKRS